MILLIFENITAIVYFAVIFFIFSFLTPLKWQYSAILGGSVIQVYTLPLFGCYPSLALLLSYSLWRHIYPRWRELLGSPMRYLLLLLLIMIVSLTWSSNIVLGLATLMYIMPFVLVYLATIVVYEKYPSTFSVAIPVFIALASIQAILTIYFRIFGADELLFLQSEIAKIFLNPNSLSVFVDYVNGGFHSAVPSGTPIKAGGFFVNPNVASGFLGITTGALFVLAVITRIKWMWTVVAVFAISTLAAGSKVSVILLCLLPLFIFSVVYLVKQRLAGFRLSNHKLASALGIGLVLFFVGIYLQGISRVHTVYERALDVRSMIWLHGWEQFKISPIFGQGFGGWLETFSSFAQQNGLQIGLPPHNTLIMLWSQSGILAVLFGLLFMGAVLKQGWMATRSEDVTLHWLGVGILFCFGWLFIHGMVTNWGIVGDIHMQPMLAGLLAYCHIRLKRTEAS